ncbi:hypothetical protein ACPV4S_24430, partial [Vibrio alginolyticus]|uniref:hypothetical protein n=1 Tax=Vibrio alginolyticus TaxID=663 RepID=UPI0040682392
RGSAPARRLRAALTSEQQVMQVQVQIEEIRCIYPSNSSIECQVAQRIERYRFKARFNKVFAREIQHAV